MLKPCFQLSAMTLLCLVLLHVVAHVTDRRVAGASEPATPGSFEEAFWPCSPANFDNALKEESLSIPFREPQAACVTRHQ